MPKVSRKLSKKGFFTQPAAYLPRNYSSPSLKSHKIHPPSKSHFGLILHRPQQM